MKTAAAILICLLLPLPSLSAPGQAEVASALIEKAWAKWQGVKDYTCIFTKRERVKGELLPEQTILMKVRENPFSIYMKWVGEEHRGQEALYVTGKNDGELKVHRGGLLGIINFNLDPEGDLAMKNDRHPITEAGIGHTIRLIREDLALARKNNEGEITGLGKKEVDGSGVHCFRAVVPPEKVKTGSKKTSPEKYYSALSEICLDAVSLLPVSVTIYDSAGELLEKYGYREVKLNVGLTDRDFDPDNAEYDF